MQDCKPHPTPLVYGQRLSKSQCPASAAEKKECLNLPYKELVGSLMYLAQGTRPDIAYAVSKLGQFSSNPGKEHWGAGKHVLRYLRGTSNYSLKLKSEKNFLEAYADADWTGDSDDRKSMTGFCIMLGGSPFFWRATKQRCIAASTMEAEYVALSACVREVLWILSLLQEVGLGDLVGYGATTIWSDNQAAVRCAVDPVPHSSARHIDLRHHMIRNAVASGAVRQN